MTAAIIILLIVVIIEFVLSNVEVEEVTIQIQPEPIQHIEEISEPEKAFETKFINESENQTITWEVKNNS